MNYQKTNFMRRFISTIIILLLLGFPHSFYGNAEKNDSVTQQYKQWLKSGENAIPELKEALRNENWRIRTYALLAMGKTGDLSLVPIILKQLENDPHQSVQNCAVIALKNLKAKKAVPTLIQLLREDKAKGTSQKTQVPKKLLVQSLSAIGDTRAVPILYKELLKANTSLLSLTIVDALATLGDRSVSQRILSDQQIIKQKKKEKEAAILLGKLPSPGAEVYLLKLLERTEKTTRSAAITALGKLQSEKAVPQLIRLLKEGDRHTVKLTVGALIAINASSSVQPLLHLFESRDPKNAIKAATILARLEEDNISKQVYALLQKRSDLNEPAAYVLGYKQYTTAAPLLEQRLKDLSQPGQDQMAKSLGWMGLQQAVPLLIEIAQRPGMLGSIGAVAGLGDLKSTKSVPVLINLLKKNKESLRVQAIVSLGKIGDPRAIQPLILLSYETGDNYSLMIARALGKIGGEKVCAYITKNIDSSNKTRSRLARLTLRQMKGTPENLALFKSLSDHPVPSINNYTAQMVRSIEAGKNTPNQ